MKILKKVVCLLIAFSLLLTLTACRKVKGDGSFYLDGVDSQVVVANGDLSDSQNDAVASNTGGTGGATSGSDISETGKPSSQSPQSSAAETASQYPPYSGNLPSVSEGNIPQFEQRGFNISGFWAPYEISEANFKQYKDVGFTEFAMINHDPTLRNTSKEQFYLGSERTMKALEICRKVGLKAIINHNDWKASQCEGKSYNNTTPFSQYDLYGDYKDIIRGVQICDEPYLSSVDIYGNKTLIDDFKKVYPNARYILNLIPYNSVTSRGFQSYEQMMQIFEERFMKPFENPYVSVDVYPFHEGSKSDDATLALNYRYIAESAKKFNVKPAFILQSSVGGGEFETSLSEADLRWEINNALAFGADTLQYYCYAVPTSVNGTGRTYDYCILKQDNTPSNVYYSLQKLHKEIKSFSNVILAYDWDKTIGASGLEESAYRVAHIEYDLDFNPLTFDNAKHYVGIKTTHDMLISRFTNQKYGEAYMFVNFADRGGNCKADISFKYCKAVAVYGGAGFNGTPKILNLDGNGNLSLNLAYGEGVFVIPLV